MIVAGMDEDAWNLAGRRAAAWYLWLQGMSGAIWWALLWVLPISRSWFIPGFEELGAGVLAGADLPIFVGGSLASGFVCLKQPKWAQAACAFVAGGVLYAFALSVGACIAGGEGGLGLLMMLGAAWMSAATVWLSGGAVGMRRCFRPADPGSLRRLGARTAVQAAVFWMVLLGLIPWVLHMAEVSAGVPVYSSMRWPVVGGVFVFGAGSAFGVASSVVMVRTGRGTPLPSESARRLVTVGPYRLVRNPMAVAGLLQGAGVALMFGSPLVAAYVVAGGIIWHGVVRPFEEIDLTERFGEDYRAYKVRVRCWLPRLPWSSSAST